MLSPVFGACSRRSGKTLPFGHVCYTAPCLNGARAFIVDRGGTKQASKKKKKSLLLLEMPSRPCSSTPSPIVYLFILSFFFLPFSLPSSYLGEREKGRPFSPLLCEKINRFPFVSDKIRHWNGGGNGRKQTAQLAGSVDKCDRQQQLDRQMSRVCFGSAPKLYLLSRNTYSRILFSLFIDSPSLLGAVHHCLTERTKHTTCLSISPVHIVCVCVCVCMDPSSKCSARCPPRFPPLCRKLRT